MNGVKQPGQRRAKEKAELQLKILAAARSLFVKRGYEAVTMREIARKIGYTATALYYHFPDKDSLLLKLCETDFLALSAYFKRLGRVADPIERIRKVGLAYVSFGLEYPQHYRLMFMTPHPEPPRDQIGIEHGNPDEDAYAYLLQAIREAIEAKRLRAEFQDPELVAQIFWAGVHGLVALQLTKRESQWIDWRSARKVAEMLAETMLRGLLRKGESLIS